MQERIVFLAFFTAVVILPSLGLLGTAQMESIIDYSHVLKQLDMNSIFRHIEYLTSIPSKEEPSRFTGYPGNDMAAIYISEYFKSIGVSVSLENFTVTVPVDLGAYITVLGEHACTIKAYPLLPNNVNPCPYVSPQSGDKLIYAGHAEFGDFDGVDLNGSVALVEFNSRWLWKNLVAFGVKAIIFIEPNDTVRTQAEQLTFKIPINVPRLYVFREAGEFLRKLCIQNRSVRIHISTKMRWEDRIVSNIIGFIQGTNPSFDREAIVLAAHYDSYSIVPSIAPGATDALGVATLLELGKYFTKNRPQRSLILLATNGYWQGLIGGRDFVSRHFGELGFKIKLFFNIDLSTDSNNLAVLSKGSLFTYALQPIEPRFAWIRDRIFTRYLPLAKSQLGDRFNVVDGIYPVIPLYEPTPVLFEGELVSLAMFGGGLVFHTTNNLRYYLKTPLDTIERLSLKNLRPQVEAILIIMHSLLQEPESFARSLPYTPTNFANDYGFSSLTVYITEYNITTAWYDPFPRVDDVLIHVSIPISYQVPIAQIQFYGTMAQGELIGAGAIGASDVIGAAGTIYMHIFMKPDKDGKAILHGVKPYTRGLVEAYVLNQTTGNIEYAPDHGTYAFKDPFIPAGENVPVGGYYIYKKDTLKTITLFKCGSIALLNVVNPITLVYEGTVEALNFLSHGAHIWHGGVSILPEAILFVPADTKTEIIVRSTQMKSALAGFYYPYVVLANASSEYPWGYGYTVKSGEVLILANPVMIWEQLHRMNWNRIQASITYHVYNELVDNYSKLSLKEYDLAQEALSNKLYSSCFGHIMTAWSYEYACYNSMVDLTVDIVTTTAYSLLILIPFILFFERLFFDMQSGRGRIACLLASLVVFILFLYAFHPGPHLATNLPMILMGFGVVLILIPVLVFSFGEAQLTISEMQRMSVGSHFVSISRASAFIMALSMGIQQMRRRKIRTVLTLTSIIATVLILVVFTSIAFTIIIYEVKSERRPVSYDGFMVHRMPWAPVTEHFLLTIENKYGREVKVCPRGWVYPPMQHLGLVGQEHALSAFVAVSPEEENVTELPRTLIDGRWFTSDDCKVIIIGKSVAEKYKVNIGSNVNIWGLNFTVIGIFSEEAYSRILDLDMAPITPLDYVLGIETGMAGIFDARLSPETIALIPFKFAQETWNILPMTISVKFSTAELSLKEASELSKIVPYDVYAGIKEDGNIGTLAIFRARAGVNPIGVEYAFIPFFISGFIILNTMLGAVYERTREVGILGSIGLAPLHIIGTFLAESLAYAVIGGVLGYFIGIISIGILDFLKAIPPGLTPNFAASFVMVAVSFSMLMAIVSTIYPAYKAGTMVTPYTERKFKIGTKPKGGVWDIPFPFVATEGEIDGLMVFFKEYYDAHSAPGTAIFVAKSTEYREFEQETGLQKVLMTTLWLKPFDLGVYETTRLIATRAKGSMTYTLTLSAKHESGLEQTWINCHRAFVKELRKQFLIWRALKPEEKHNYIKRSKTELKRLES